MKADKQIQLSGEVVHSGLKGDGIPSEEEQTEVLRSEGNTWAVTTLQFCWCEMLTSPVDNSSLEEKVTGYNFTLPQVSVVHSFALIFFLTCFLSICHIFVHLDCGFKATLILNGISPVKQNKKNKIHLGLMLRVTGGEKASRNSLETYLNLII